MKNIMENILSDVSKLNAEGDLIFSSSKSLKMSSQNGAISTYNVSGSQILGLRLIKEGRVGVAFTESLDSDSLKLMVKKAFENSDIAQANMNESILKMSGHVSDIPNYSEENVSLELKTAKAIELETEVKKLDARVTAVPYNSYSEQEYSSQYLSSSGRSTHFSDKQYSIVTSAVMDASGKKSSFHDHQSSHDFKGLSFKKIIDTAYFHSKNLLEEKTLPTGKYHIRFTEDSLQSLFGCFGNLFSAKAAINKLNPWANNLGQKVISTDISIIDHPLYEKSFRMSKFDSEGMERKKLGLIENGVLNSFLHNSMTAKHFNTQTTGHASRSPGSSLDVSGTDLIIMGSNSKPIPARFLEVIQMDGLYSGANRVTGTFSVAVKGYIWEGGERKGTFGNITLSGNWMELLKTVEVVGTDLKASTDDSFFTVPLIFPDLAVSGT